VWSLERQPDVGRLLELLA